YTSKKDNECSALLGRLAVMRMTSDVAWLPYLQLLCSMSALWAYPFRPPLDLDVIPRTTVLYTGLWGCRRFSDAALNYSTLLLEEEAGVLYVGARGSLYALHAPNISGSRRTIDWEAPEDQKQLCLNIGKDNKNSGEFKISSVFEEGREKCPYDPAKGYTGLIADGQMYTASQYEFWSSPDIRRNSPNPTLRTEDAPTRWLHEADFVGSALLRESANNSVGDDDKVYFFFTEKSEEHTPYFSHSRVARVARVCKRDRGGLLTLQKKWTSFLKARLVCSLPAYEFHFNVLRGVFVLDDTGAQDAVLYAIFGLEWKSIKASAICRYSMADVRQAFDGPYMESTEDGNPRAAEYTGKIPEPRPGSCITDQLRARGINFSTDLPDDVLHFVRRHPLMSRQILPLGQRPLLFKRTVDYTKIAVHQVAALDGQMYHMLFIGTDEGWLQRAVEVKGALHIIEELQLFEEPQPVDSIVISPKQMSVYVGSPSAVVQLPLSTCGRYMSCTDCVLARDPFCAWDGKECVEITSHTDRSSLTQDILNGNEGCEESAADAPSLHRMRYVMAGDDVLLQCELASNLASSQWTLQGQELQGYGLGSGYRIGTDGLLVIGAQPGQSGEYACFSLENGVRVPVVVYALTVKQDPRAEPPVKATLLPPYTSPAPQSPHPAPIPLPPNLEFLSLRNMEAMYLSLITILGGLCLVLTVVLLYVGFCVQGRRGKYSLRAAARADRKKNTHMELKTISSHCNGKVDTHDGLLHIVPGEAQLPPAPPLPPPLPNSETEYTNGLSATLPSVLRKMNGNSYVLLRQSDGDTISPLYYSFTEELNRILEKRKHMQLCSKPDESSV
ncbi:hypothetical protein P4O66_013574, partial [Electrophorus voltai]